MKSLPRYVALPLVLALILLAGLYLSTGGRFDQHFHRSIVDRSPQASIHVVVMDSGFHLQQTIDTRNLDRGNKRLNQAPICTWMRMEYPRNNRGWTTSGTVELRLSIPDHTWTTRFRSEQITTGFQPFCFKDATAQDIFDQPTQLDMSIVEPGLKKVAMIALGPANGENNAQINGQRSDYTATYILTANPGPRRKDIIRLAVMGLLTLAILLSILIPFTRRNHGSAQIPSSVTEKGNQT